MSATLQSEVYALRPGGGDATRAQRARSEPMAVLPVGGGVYDVVTGDGHVYAVDLVAGRCTCPDHQFRGAHCKHLRRVAIDVTEGRAPAPGQRVATCGDCGRTFFADECAPDPVYCADCHLDPGTFVVDDARGDLLVVVRTTDARADAVEIPGTGHTVADYPGNAAYDDRDVVVEAVYPVGPADPDRVRQRPPRVYSFPRGRLRRAGR